MPDQLDALRDAGVVRSFEEKDSGTRDDRPELSAVLDYFRPPETPSSSGAWIAWAGRSLAEFERSLMVDST